MKFIQPEWPAQKKIKAFTTVRKTWGQASAKRITLEERLTLKTVLQLPNDPIWLTQTHSNIVIEARPENRDQTADACFTSASKQICMIETADCMPILICNQQATAVAAIHAGWRGLANGIIENTLSALNLSPNDLLVWLGPAIGPQHFEVGKDVYDAFTSSQPGAASAFTPHTEGKWLANLYALAKMRLASQGVENIYGGNFCTFAQDELFFSYRRDKGITGRMASLIWIE